MKLHMRNKDWSSYLFPLLFWNIIYTRPLIVMFPERSTLILFLFSLGFLALYLTGIVTGKIVLTVNRGYLSVYAAVIMFSVSFLFGFNDWLPVYMYQFFSRVFLLVLIFLSVRDFKLLLKNYCYLSILALALYGFVPFLKPDVFSNYMDYGFTVATPGFFGIYIARKYFQIKIAAIFEVIAWISIIVFSNRSSILSVLTFILFYSIYIENKDLRFMLKWTAGAGILGALLTNAVSILSLVRGSLTAANYNSYSVNRLYEWIVNGDTYNLSSGRDRIADVAFDVIRDNVMFGTGVGTFESMYNVYSHNIILDFLLYWGIFGVMVLGVMLVLGLWLMKTQEDSTRMVLVLTFCMWFPKLLFSSSFLVEPGFWLYISSILLFSKGTLYRRPKNIT